MRKGGRADEGRLGHSVGQDRRENGKQDIVESEMTELSSLVFAVLTKAVKVGQSCVRQPIRIVRERRSFR